MQVSQTYDPNKNDPENRANMARICGAYFGIKEVSPSLYKIAAPVSELPETDKNGNKIVGDRQGRIEEAIPFNERSLRTFGVVYRYESTASFIGIDGKTYVVPDDEPVMKHLKECGYVIAGHGDRLDGGLNPEEPDTLVGKDENGEVKDRRLPSGIIKKIEELENGRPYANSMQAYSKLRRFDGTLGSHENWEEEFSLSERKVANIAYCQNHQAQDFADIEDYVQHVTETGEYLRDVESQVDIEVVQKELVGDDLRNYTSAFLQEFFEYKDKAEKKQESINQYKALLAPDKNLDNREEIEETIKSTMEELEELKAEVSIMRPPSQEDIDYREDLLKSFADQVGSIVPEDCPVRFAGVEYKEIEFIMNRGVLNTPKAWSSLSVYEAQKVKTPIVDEIGINDFSRPLGCLFLVLPKDRDDLFSSSWKNILLRKEPERLAGILTSPESVGQIKKWCEQYDIQCDSNNICDFNEFVERVKAKYKQNDDDDQSEPQS